MSDAVLSHYQETFGDPTRQGRFQPRGRDEVVLVYKWPPEVTGRDVTFYATAGASAFTSQGEGGRPEFLVTLDPERDEVASPLAELAHFQLQKGMRVGSGHTLMLSESLWPGSEMSGFVIVKPHNAIVPDLTTAEGRVVDFLVAIPISESEVAFKREHGIDALVGRWHEYDVDWADPARAPVPLAD